MHVRPATPDDAEAVHAVHVAAVRDLASDVYRDAVVRSWTRDLAPGDYELDDDDPFLVAVADDSDDECAAGRESDVVADGCGRTLAATDETAAASDERTLADDDETDLVVGFGSATFTDPGDEATARVTGIYVHPTAARRGAGATLESTLAERARGAGCEALSLEASVNAVPFYHGRGYEPVAATSHRFGGAVPGPALEMRREL